jgi:uncharacterized membrane protein YqaE (UPF0057 family)
VGRCDCRPAERCLPAGGSDADHNAWKETAMDCLRVVLSVIIPPVGVFLKVGFGLQFWVNILLTLLGYIPGLVHAIWIIASR